jgi:hypothetical protein
MLLQELKAQQDNMQPEFITPHGMTGYFHYAQKKGYSGVGIYSKKKPDAVIIGLGGSNQDVADIDSEGRYIECQFGNLSVVSLYLPSGSSGEERQAFKFSVMARFMLHMQALIKSGREVVVCGDGTACVTAFQAIRIRTGMKLFHNSGCASMGYDVPAAIGASMAMPRKERIICLAGDGSIMMNLQELQTVSGLKLPIKIFVLNNTGYHSIRQTQRNFFPDNIVGCGEDSGLSFPDFEKVATAFNLPFRRIQKHDELDDVIRWVLTSQGPVLCEVMLDLAQGFAPKLSSRKLEDGRMETAPLDDMAPFLSREELAENIIT